MFQTIAAWLLKTYVGEYIENLNADQLTIGYGGLELENLILKPSALKKLGLPIKLISGSIGRLNLVIPYGNPSTEPWIIKIGDLSLAVEADDLATYDYNLEEEHKKHRKLDKLEAEWKLNKQNGRAGSWWSRSWFPSIYSSISTRIADNLQIDINNVNVKYVCPHLSFTIAIESLSGHTTNAQWEKTTQSWGNEMKYKLIELEGLSLYSHWANASVQTKENATYMLGPIYAEARIKRNSSRVSLTSKDGPRFHIELVLEDVLLSLTDNQYRAVAAVGEDLNRYFRSLGHSKLRPSVSVRENPSIWWQFAFNSVIEPIKERNRRHTKDFLVKRISDINLYAVLYSKYLCGQILDSNEKDSLESIESTMKYEEIAILRRALYVKHDQQQVMVSQVASPPAATASWSGWIMSFNPLSNQQSESHPDNTEALSITKEEEEFLDELSEMSVEGEASVFNRDSIFAQIAFTLTSGCIVLRNEDRKKEVLNISFDGLNVSSEVHSKSRSWEWMMTLQTFVIKNPNDDDHTFPNLMGPQGVVNGGTTESNNGGNFLLIKLGQRQLHGKCLYNVVVNMQPSNVIYNFKAVTDVKEFFVLQEKSKYTFKLTSIESMSNRFQEAVNTQIRELKLATKAEFGNIIAGSRKQFTHDGDEWTFDLDINAPRIILPVQTYQEEVISDELHNKMVIFDLGRLTFYNDHAKPRKSVVMEENDSNEQDDEDSDEFLTPSSTPPQEEDVSSFVSYVDSELDSTEILEKFYDNYTMELSNIQVLVSTVTKEWVLSQPKGFGRDHIIEKCSVKLSLKRRISFTTDSNLPALTLSTVLPQLYVHIDQMKLSVLFRSVNMLKAAFSNNNVPVESSVKSVISGEDLEHKVSSTNIFEINYEDLLTESKLLLAKFSIEKISLALHSRDRCFAELQIEGVECEYVKRPHDMSLSFILSSLLLVDAMQTFGSDYELLVSSKCIGDEQSNDVLIHICYQMINGDCPSLGNCDSTPVQIISANFNALHINGNLQTIVELHNVVNQVLNQQQNKSPSKSQVLVGSETLIEEEGKENEEGKIEIAAHFKQINILLFYGITEDELETPKTVAKIVADDLQLNSTMGLTRSSSGGIGSIIIIDLSSESLPDKQIFSVGYQGYNTCETHSGMEERKAFTFVYSNNVPSCHGMQEDSLNVEMASAYYTHNPHFLKQVGLCVGHFKQHAYNLAKSLQSAASDMAKSMVSAKRPVEEMAKSMVSAKRPVEEHHDELFMDDVHANPEKISGIKSKLKFSVSVETPIVYFPRDLTSNELLVCNLGKITTHNTYFMETDLNSENQETDRMIVEIQRINLSVVKLPNTNAKESQRTNDHIHMFITQNKFNHTMIIHNTDVFLQVDKIYCYKKSIRSMRNTFKLDGRINSALKLFLSVPTYQQILSTLQFASDMTNDKRSPSEPNVMQSSDDDTPSVSYEVPEEDIPDITAKFQMPSLQLELHGELQGKPHGFVYIECDKFNLDYMNMGHHMYVIDISLHDLLIEDLLRKSNDRYCYLLRSGELKDTVTYNQRPSSSCPESTGWRNVKTLSKSLPDIPTKYECYSLQSSFTDISNLSPQSGGSGPMISVKLTSGNTDSEHEENQATKVFTIDVNCVDLVINLQTWVILFEFFGIGTQPNPSSPVKQQVVNAAINDEVVAQFELTQYKMNIQSVMFYLNKEEYPLAKAGVDKLNFNAMVSPDSQDVSGSIGTVELHDLSPHNGCFIKRMVTMGDNAFEFTFYRYAQPDPELSREFDMSLSLYMSSIQYIHTQRFLIECISFCQHFVFLQEVLGRMRAASAGDEVYALVNRSPRVKLKVNTDAPILILPRKSTSRDVLVANLGKLDVENKFVYASDPDTEAFNFIASRSRHNVPRSPRLESNSDRLLDCIKVKLSDMQVYTARKVEDSSDFEMFEEQGSRMMCEPCTLELKVERNIEWAFGRQVPDMSVTGQLSSVYLFIDLAQYGQIMDMLSENLGEPLDTFNAPSSVLVDPLEMTSPTQQLWTTLRIKLHLSNVSIESHDTFSYGELKGSCESARKLAKFDLIQSDLLFESFSDGSKSIDLMSSDVLIYDIRNDGKTQILLPSDKSGQQKDYLQFEIHYLDTNEKSLLTFLCNQSRILLQFDFLYDTSRFILRAEENQHKDDHKATPPPVVTVSGSRSPTVLTKPTYQNVMNTPKKSFELKVNVTDSELVVVEDITALDTRTVILKTTAVFAYRPEHFSERPITCSLQSLEIFSCHLNQPDDSALSIVDPVAFLVELKSGKKAINEKSQGLLDAMQNKPVLDVQFQVPVYLRLSYHDVQMFMQIANSAKEQIAKALEGGKNDTADCGMSSSSLLASSENDSEQLSNSSHRGISLKEALNGQSTSNSSQPASPKLNSNRSATDVSSTSSTKSTTDSGHVISAFEAKVNFVSITLIDDCGNNEVPLIDLSLRNLVVQHSYDHQWKGTSDCNLDADYYNTRVSAWEPLIEGWRFNVHWLKAENITESVKTAVKVGAPSRLDINLTNSFIDITNKTANLWSSRFYLDAYSKEKKRAPFLPFLLRNRIGCKLTFHTLTKSPAKMANKTRKKEVQKEFEVVTNGELAFTFEGRTKLRHQASHKLMVHQIVIQIPGKFDIQPITVDRVGQFFRIAYNSSSNEESSSEDAINDVYLLIDINLEGARKVITVKSALSIMNNLTMPIEIVGRKNEQHYNLTVIDAKETYIVPLPLIQCDLFCRPIRGNISYQLSDELCWRKVTSRGEKGFVRTCYGEASRDNIFRFCALVQCIGFPKYDDFVHPELYQPEHVITITHHILICNQLPFDLFYIAKGKMLKELVKPGETVPMHLMKDDTAPLEVGFSFENFPHYDWTKISYEDIKYMLPVRVCDTQNRLLILHAVIACRSGAIQISVFAPYWLINKTGIPLVFRREEETVEIAGQFDEHEEARSLTPLPFSFLSSEDNYNCQVRVGKRYQCNSNFTPLWSKPFSLEKENEYRTLYVRERRDKPEKGYNVGIVMQWGKGVYSQTKILSFVPRFQIDNQTTKALRITQKCMVDEKNSHRGTLCPLDAVTIFHWPRCNVDNLLCVRFDDELSLWSGCIKIDCETTYHLNVKSNGRSNGVFLRIHISFQGGTFRATFTDSNTFPPPFKFINRSDVALFYWQDTGKTNDSLSTFIKAKEAKKYVLDEPLMPAKLVVSVYQDSVRTYDLRQNGKHQAKLYYQNPIFIAFSHTFDGKLTCKHSGVESTQQQLVIDAVSEKCIVLNQKADHKRSQLWRMNASGNLVHFDSTTMKDTTRNFNSNNILVLDVDDTRSGDTYPLVLSHLNQRRKKTQTWYFESDTLRCCVEDYIVHMHNANGKSIAVLGLKNKLHGDDVRTRTCVRSEKLRPGSGVLSAYVYSSGPTQVLEISDSQQENTFDSWMLVDHTSTNHNLLTCTSVKESPSTEVVISLASGFGISVINFHPEEVVFISLSQINFTLNYNEMQYFADVEIGKIQVDNQLFGCQAPVSIYASPPKKTPVKRSVDVRFDMKLERDTEFDLFVFKKFSINMSRMIIILEDRLFLKIIQIVQNLMMQPDEEGVKEEPTSIFDSHKINGTNTHAKRKLFFEDIVINQGDLTVSLIVTGKIDKDLLPLKSALGIPLVSFEAAIFGFDKYHKSNMYDTSEHILSHIIQYYKTTFISQAAVLLGSLDILGNPMGLIQDFSSGIEGLLKKGNLGGLFVNVAHGFSDSAAKMTGVIADGLWSASMDNKFLESRDSMRVSRDSSSSSHFSAGLRGLGMGVFGGLTSMVTQPIEGASKKGFSGFFTGIGKGLVGTVAKPMAGVLDLASGTAAAVRNTTESASAIPNPVQLKRNCYGPGGVLGKYSKNASEGQDIILKFNDGNTSEKYIGMESVRTTPDRLKVLFTNKGLYFVKSGPPCPENIKLHVEYSRLLDSSYYFEERHHIIEIYFCKRQNVGVRKPSVDTRTTIRCDNERIAFKVCEKINYLKSLHLESLYVIANTSES